jgi:hypothetical protein
MNHDNIPDADAAIARLTPAIAALEAIQAAGDFNEDLTPFVDELKSARDLLATERNAMVARVRAYLAELVEARRQGSRRRY